jgi:phosphatidylglycerophosphate synthase
MNQLTSPIGDRRPIAVRRWSIFHNIAAWLAGCGVSPNAISVAGMICGIGAGLSLAMTSHWGSWSLCLAWLGAALLIQLRLLANLLDGMVAVEYGKASAVGELYNEVPDRISDAAVLIGAGYALGSAIPLGYLAACVAMFTAYIRAMGKAAGAASEFCGPMAKQQRMFTITVLSLYAGLAPADLLPTDAAGHGLMAAGLLLIIVLGMATAIRRLIRIAAHLRTSNPN